MNTARILLAHGADINAVNGLGHTSLDLAVAGDNKNMKEFLQQRGGLYGRDL